MLDLPEGIKDRDVILSRMILECGLFVCLFVVVDGDWLLLLVELVV